MLLSTLTRPLGWAALAAFLVCGCLPPQAKPVNVAVAYTPQKDAGVGELPPGFTRQPLSIGMIVDQRTTDHEQIGAWMSAEGTRPITTTPHLLHHWIRIGLTKELAAAGVLFHTSAEQVLEVSIREVQIVKQGGADAIVLIEVHLIRGGQTLVSSTLRGEAKVKVADRPEDTVNLALSEALLDALKKLVKSPEFVRRLPQ